LFQSNVIGCATVASFAGLTSVGAKGVGGGADEVISNAPAMEKFSNAQISTCVVVVTEVVVTGKLTLVAPWGTVTLAGTLAPDPRVES
jgi:hypothetical protein